MTNMNKIIKQIACNNLVATGPLVNGKILPTIRVVRGKVCTNLQHKHFMLRPGIGRYSISTDEVNIYSHFPTQYSTANNPR